MAKTKTPSGLSMKHKIGYACGDLGGCMTFALMGSIVTRYYTNVLQVNTVVLATMLLVWNVWDAVNDPLMGAPAYSVVLASALLPTYLPCI